MPAPRLVRLAPHAPLPERGPFVLVLRRLSPASPGEDDPAMALTELVLDDGTAPARIHVPVAGNGTPADFEDGVDQAIALAESRGIDVVFAVDRTAGAREAEVLAQADRPHDAGFDRSPER